MSFSARAQIIIILSFKFEKEKSQKSKSLKKPLNYEKEVPYKDNNKQFTGFLS